MTIVVVELQSLLFFILPSIPKLIVLELLVYFGFSRYQGSSTAHEIMVLDTDNTPFDQFEGFMVLGPGLI